MTNLCILRVNAYGNTVTTPLKDVEIQKLPHNLGEKIDKNLLPDIWGYLLNMGHKPKPRSDGMPELEIDAIEADIQKYENGVLITRQVLTLIMRECTDEVGQITYELFIAKPIAKPNIIN